MLIPLEVSEVQFLPIKPQGSLIGFSSLVLNDSLYAGAIGVHTRPDGSLRLLFPGRILPNGKKIQVFHPINHETEEILRRAVEARVMELASSWKRP